MKSRERLRIAIQKSGRLSAPARDLLERAGLAFRESRDRLFCFGESLPIDLLLVRDDDIPGLIAEGVCDLGVVGNNVLEEQAVAREQQALPAAYQAIRQLGFGGCRLSLAVPQEWPWNGPGDLAGKRVATSYPQLLGRWLRQNAVDAQVVELSGSVEIAPRLGKADAICDLVSSGATLLANQLRETAVIFHSEAVLVAPVEPFEDARSELAALLLRRLDGVLSVRDSKLVMFQAARSALPELLTLLPDAEAPTVLSLDGALSEVALQAVCRTALTWQRLEDLKRACARRVLLLPAEPKRA